MQRVLMIGSNGAGKTTFSYALAEKTGLPLIHLDQIYWRGKWEVSPQQEFEQTVLQHAQQPCWIIEGNCLRTLPQRLAYADTVLWFEFPRLQCVFNILKREWHYRGKARPEMPPDCISRLDFKFLKYAWNFNLNNRYRIAAMLLDAPQVKVVRFRDRRAAQRYLESL